VRKPHHLLASTAVFALLVAACGTEENNNGGVSASIDGTPFTALIAFGTYTGNVLTIGGLSGSTSINLTVPNVTTTGTLSLASGQAGIAEVDVNAQNWSTSVTGGTGSITVTSISSTQASGTFTFSAPATVGSGATGTKVVTNGVFTVAF
jgi:hypothetical protein